MGWMGTGIARDDERKRFVVIATDESCIWKAAKSTLWHATVDGIHAVCSPAVIVTDDDAWPSEVDRSDSLMTCKNCQERVRVDRARSEPA